MFDDIVIDQTGHVWIECKVIMEDDNRRFIGVGGPTNLEKLLRFLRKG